MKLFEYQAKELFASHGIPVPNSALIHSLDQLDGALAQTGLPCVIKCQVLQGGRGKAGLVKMARNKQEARRLAEDYFAQVPRLKAILGEEAVDYRQELYLGLSMDAKSGQAILMASGEGGVDIEKTAQENPDAIQTLNVNFVQGLQPYQCREMGFALGLSAKQVNQLTRIMLGLYRLFNEKDLALVELNPLAVLKNGDLAVLDGKVNSDDNASFRHPDLVAMRDIRQEDETEVAASQHDLNYVTMDGDIGCMVNGAGLAMATMDVIKLEGGEPANFLDVGGGANKERVTEAFKLILSDEDVKAIFVNIFGGIVRCDMIAEGIIAAVKEVDVKVPVIVRLEGTNVEEGKKLLRESGLAITPADDINDGARKAVAAVKQAA